MTFFTTPELLEIGDIPMTSMYEKPTRTEALKYYRASPITTSSTSINTNASNPSTAPMALSPCRQPITWVQAVLQGEEDRDSYRLLRCPQLLNVPGETYPRLFTITKKLTRITTTMSW